MSKPTKQKFRNIHPCVARDTSHRLGFMQGEIAVPDDFDQMGKNEIIHSFKAATISTLGYRFNRDVENERSVMPPAKTNKQK